MPRLCSFGCPANDLTMHSFPKPDKFPERFKTWVTLVGGKLETESDYTYYSKRKVCDKHFTDRDRNRYKRLNALAIPSLHLLGRKSGEATNQQDALGTHPTPSMSVELQNPQVPYTASQLTEGDNFAVLEDSNMVSSKNRALLKQKKSKPSQSRKDAALLSILMDHNYSTASRYTRKASKKGGTEKTVLRYLRSEICRLRKRAKSYKDRLSQATKLCKDNAFGEVVKNMSKRAQLLIHMQLQGQKKQKGRRFTIDEKVLALSLYKKSPKGYGLLYKYFTFPSSKAMKRLLTQVKIRTGINPIVFEKIRHTVLRNKKQDRLCSLMFDEMSLKAQVTYNASKDSLEGFANNDVKKFADHALVFMVKGIKRPFKQPIAYYFTNGLKKNELKMMLKEVIKVAQKSGLIIINTVCDQSSVNVGAVSELVNDTKAAYCKKGKEWRHDVFTVNDQTIIPIFDAPHLIKGMRNNLITKEMLYTINNIEKRVKWEYYQQVYAADKRRMELALLDKITEEHLVPEKMNKMRVKLATQLFSHSYAVAADHLTTRGDVPEECKNLIDITLLLDNIFDSLNVSSFHVPNGKQYKGAIKRNSPHFKLWRTARKVLKTVKFLRKTTLSNKIRFTEVTIPSVTNLIKTIEGMEEIWKVVTKKYGLDALLTRNLNQDPVENFFGNIRSYGVRNVAPNIVGFESAYKALLLNNFNTQHSIRANCEADENECLENLKFFLSPQNAETPSSDEPEREIPCHDEIMMEHSEIVDAGQRNYVCGWVLTKLLKKVVKRCLECRKALIDETHENDNNAFIRAKEYENKNWLTYPSKELEICFQKLQSIATGVLKKNVPKKNLKASVVILADVLMDFPFNCDQHKNELKKEFMDISINILIYSWCRSINRILDGKLTYDENEGDEYKTAAQIYYNKHKHIKNKK